MSMLDSLASEVVNMIEVAPHVKNFAFDESCDPEKSFHVSHMMMWHHGDKSQANQGMKILVKTAIVALAAFASMNVLFGVKVVSALTAFGLGLYYHVYQHYQYENKEKNLSVFQNIFKN